MTDTFFTFFKKHLDIASAVNYEKASAWIDIQKVENH
jgi:hypothetical protein